MKDRKLRSKLKIISVALVIVVAALFLWASRDRVINSTNMMPTLMKGDKIGVKFIDGFSYIPERWDMVLYKSPFDTLYVGRIIGLPGESVALKEGSVFINGERVVYPEYIQRLGVKYYSNFEILKDPKYFKQAHQLNRNEYFILGDNSKRSHDSRTFGSVRRDRVLMKVYKK